MKELYFTLLSRVGRIFLLLFINAHVSGTLQVFWSLAFHGAMSTPLGNTVEKHNLEYHFSSTEADPAY